MIFNLASVVNWKVNTAKNQLQVDIDNACKNDKRVRHDYAVGDLVYMDMAGIYHKLYYEKYGPYRINKLFTNGTI